ncbi:MAG: MBL fold metallo-hydrolase [Candidatus Omnitrophica bacterium]|nr:MBL fold metallo-hydrolase [Candidatus Omnitrophota bacterium]
MKIKVLYDNTAADERYDSGWGFSCLVDGRVLFDTGEDGESLLKNMKLMAEEPEDIEAIVISHDHWDHTGGLPEILTRNKGLRTYVCPGFSRSFKRKVNQMGGSLMETEGLTEIKEDIFTTGPIQGEYKMRGIEEQALALKTGNGITVITGCAHPGIVRIVEEVKKKFPGEGLYCVFGGFHLKDKGKDELNTVADELERLGMNKYGPAHCSGGEAKGVFRDRFGDDFIRIASGKTVEV